MGLLDAHLLQTEYECLGTENLIRLSGFTESFFNDVTVIIVVLKTDQMQMKIIIWK